ncbi:N-acetylglutamate synthase [Hartmannibacter diazotrophicus]|uniref:N-acetylglutamate synthase n=1 Tax=Hartmannibacter diazotrophicus TaxID=1482074 RepID=A0A2C9DCB1_9HYPH|nr:GNAT family N-acetyltransferase [Hartmannibacter diazotrophicus]SON57896.1 N-acetylglutamate synthase [Hartmannibacter diazotrophicus]
MTIEIRRFEPRDADGVIGLILPIQQDEFGVAITAEDQPDLKAIPDFYQTGLGDFWVAVTDEGRIVGTISLKDIGDKLGALRKMFVAAEWRGRERGVASGLLERLLTTSRERGIRSVFLGTTDKFHAAHRFYEKNGFAEIAKADLPESFPLIAVDTKFYTITL